MKNSKSVIPYLGLFFTLAIGLPYTSKKVSTNEIIQIEVGYHELQKEAITTPLHAELNQ